MALLAKKWFVEIDEFDRSERLLLNFGHTFGHALEAASDFLISHGVAVALGMQVAIRYSNLTMDGNNISLNAYPSMLDEYLVKLLSPIKDDLQITLSNCDLNLLMTKFENDKKHTQDNFRIVIPSAADGRLELKTVPKNENSRALIKEAYMSALELYKFSV
jgi:3-dehydroquinate synthase